MKPLLTTFLSLFLVASCSLAKPELRQKPPEKSDLLRSLSQTDVQSMQAEALIRQLRPFPLVPAELAIVVPFVHSSNRAVFSEAFSFLRNYTREPQVMQAMQHTIQSGSGYASVTVALFFLASATQKQQALSAILERIKTTNDAHYRREALFYLKSSDDLRMLPLYYDALRDDDRWVRYVAIHVLRSTTGQAFGYHDQKSVAENKEALAEWGNWIASNPHYKPFLRKKPTLGLLIADKRDGMSVHAVIPGCAADRAGVLPHSRLLEVDSRPTEGKRIDELVAFELSGKEGTQVSLTLQQNPGQGTKTVIVTRKICDIVPSLSASPKK